MMIMPEKYFKGFCVKMRKEKKKTQKRGLCFFFEISPQKKPSISSKFKAKVKSIVSHIEWVRLISNNIKSMKLLKNNEKQL